MAFGQYLGLCSLGGTSARGTSKLASLNWGLFCIYFFVRHMYGKQISKRLQDDRTYVFRLNVQPIHNPSTLKVNNGNYRQRAIEICIAHTKFT